MAKKYYIFELMRANLLAVVIGVVVVILIIGLVVCTAWSWVILLLASYPNTSTFIGSSDVVKLGCYSMDTVQSVTINKTSSTEVYYSDQSSNDEALIIRSGLNETEPRQLDQPFKFQVYYLNYNKPLFSVQSGHVIYNFTVQKNELPNNCTLEIFVFDSYFDFASFLNTPNTVQYFNRTCLVTNKTEDVFVVDFPLPAQQCTYMAGLASAGVDKMSYSVIGGAVTSYDTSKLINKTHCHEDKTCFVTIGGKFGIQSLQRCLFVSKVLEDSAAYYNYIQAEVTKVIANRMTVSFTTCLLLFTTFFLSLAICYRYRRSKICTYVSASMSTEEANPLLNTQQVRRVASPKQETSADAAGSINNPNDTRGLLV